MPEANIDPVDRSASGLGSSSGEASRPACELIGVRTVGEALDHLFP
jgi:hypothetical protein